MDGFRVNKGVAMTGGEINTTQFAVGDGAHNLATLPGDALEQRHLQEIRQKLDDLLKVLDANEDAIENVADVRDTAASVAKELDKDKPNKLTVKALLEGIGENVKSATAVATAVQALKVAVAALV